jgi:hypothetical protein
MELCETPSFRKDEEIIALMSCQIELKWDISGCHENKCTARGMEKEICMASTSTDCKLLFIFLSANT